MTRALRIASLILLTCIIAGPAAADRYVAQAGQPQDPAHEYTDWSIAASNIQTAVDAADPGETVWVSNGVYRSASSPVVNISKSLSLRSVVTNTAVVIDGEYVEGGTGHRGILVTFAAAMEVVIEGLTVSNCWQGYTGGGGGIYLDNTAGVVATGAVRNCRIVKNRAISSSTGVGGGIYALGAVGNSSFFVHIDACEVTDNFVGSNGGGILLERVSSLLESSIITGNQSDNWDPFADPPVVAYQSRGAGGIGLWYPGAGSVIRNCVIENNRTSRWGGGILSRYDGELLVENCTFRGNVAPEGAGICIANHSGNPTNIVRGCLFDHNWALTNTLSTSYGYGGGLLIGGVLGAGNNVHVENCTVVSNIARIDGGGVRIHTAGGMTAWNSIFYNNWTTGDSDSNYYGTATWTNCLVGTADVLPGSGNITDQGPSFVDFDGQDYHLTRTSPCVDNGYNLSSWMDADARDLDGEFRVRPAGGTVDIGCYEYQPTGTLISIM